jgi:phosphatidylinositol-bisphosphatase
VPAHYHFVPKLEEENVCKPWLTLRPRFGMLMPGDVAEITFTINVDTKTAQVSSIYR